MMKYEYRQFICSPCRCFACTLHECMVTRNLYRGWILGRNADKSLKRVFLLAIHSHIYTFSLRFLFLQTHATSYSFFSSLLYTVKEKGRKPNRKPYPLPNTLKNPYGNLKPENSQDNAQKPQRNCRFMNSASGREGWLWAMLCVRVVCEP